MIDDDSAAMLVLRKYFEGQERWVELRGDDFSKEHPVEFEELLKWSRVISDQEIGSHRVVAVAADYGDEGGAAEVYAFFTKHHFEEGWELDFMVSEFDTSWKVEWAREYDSGKAGFVFSEVRVDSVEAMGYKLGLQEYSDEERALQAKMPVIR